MTLFHDCKIISQFFSCNGEFIFHNYDFFLTIASLYRYSDSFLHNCMYIFHNSDFFLQNYALYLTIQTLFRTITSLYFTIMTFFLHNYVFASHNSDFFSTIASLYITIQFFVFFTIQSSFFLALENLCIAILTFFSQLRVHIS